MNEVLQAAGFSLNEKDFYFYSNIVIISTTVLIVTYLLKRETKDLDDLDSYDWSRFAIVGENKYKMKKSDQKEKPKQRIKEFSKGTGFIKDENRFPVLINERGAKENTFLTFEETNNFQDLINYAATMNKEGENIYPIESLYNQVLNTSNNNDNDIKANEKIDTKMNEILLK